MIGPIDNAAKVELVVTLTDGSTITATAMPSPEHPVLVDVSSIHIDDDFDLASEGGQVPRFTGPAVRWRLDVNGPLHFALIEVPR